MLYGLRGDKSSAIVFGVAPVGGHLSRLPDQLAGGMLTRLTWLDEFQQYR